MNQKIGKRKVILGIVGAIVTLAGVTAAVVAKKPSEALKESSEALKPVPKQALVRGMIGNTPVYCWVGYDERSLIKSEMLLMKKLKAPGDTILQLVSPSYENNAFEDSTVVSFHTMTNVTVE